MASVLLSASVERCFVSRVRDFFYTANMEKALVSLFFEGGNIKIRLDVRCVEESCDVAGKEGD